MLDKHLLYLSHGLSSFGDRVWQFAVPILFLQLWVDTLLAVAVSQLVIQGGLTFLLPTFGTWIGSTSRIRVIMCSILINNLMTAISCSLLVAMPWIYPAPITIDETSYLLAIIVLCGLIGELFNQAGTIALEKHWVVILAGKNDKYLTEMNSTMKRIDLGTKLVAPLIVGILVDSLNGALQDRIAVFQITAAIVGVWNLLSMVFEVSSALTLYRRNEALQRLQEDPSSPSPSKPMCAGWRAFAGNELFLPGVALAFLYCSVLTNGVLMTAWLEYEGVLVTVIGAGRAAGALFGIGSTYIFSYLVDNFTLEMIGLANIVGFFLFMTFPSICFALMDYVGVSVVVWVLMCAVSSSRVFLWLFDMTFAQMVQKDVYGDTLRGEFSAAQYSSCTFFQTLIYVVGVIVTRPQDFYILAYCSSGAVGCSFLCYLYWFMFVGRVKSTYEERMPISMDTDGLTAA